MKKRVRAIILKDDEIILIKREKTPNEIYWVFPGGAVESDDQDIESAIRRECKEELGIDVYVDSLFIEQEFNNSLELFYFCNIRSGILGRGDGPEYKDNNFYIGSHHIEKIKIKDLKKINLKPLNIRDKVFEFYNKINN